MSYDIQVMSNFNNSPDYDQVLENRYQIVGLLSSGTSSNVYAAIDHNLNRPVAIKMLNESSLNNQESFKRFINEGKVLSKLQHRNIVNIYDVFVTENYAFMVMELVFGSTLSNLIDIKGPMPVYAATETLIPVLYGLEYAHSNSILHRDIKPNNIMISENSTIKITDFGIANNLQSQDPRITSTNMIVGTAGYLSPEQVTDSNLTVVSDIYSLGITFFELLTGQLPFKYTDPIRLAYERMNTELPLPSSLVSGIPEEIDEIFIISTQLNPKHRYQNAKEMLDHIKLVATSLQFPEYVPQADPEQIDNLYKLIYEKEFIENNSIQIDDTQMDIYGEDGSKEYRISNSFYKELKTFSISGFLIILIIITLSVMIGFVIGVYLNGIIN